MRIVILLVFCIAAINAGVIDHTRCGGAGTFREARIYNSTGAIAFMNPGYPYLCEGDFVPSSANSALRFKVYATYLGFKVPLIDVVLENSSVQPGVAYTVRFTVTPNDILANNIVPIESKVSSNHTGLVEFCVILQVHVNCDTFC